MPPARRYRWPFQFALALRHAAFVNGAWALCLVYSLTWAAMAQNNPRRDLNDLVSPPASAPSPAPPTAPIPPEPVPTSEAPLAPTPPAVQAQADAPSSSNASAWGNSLSLFGRAGAGRLEWPFAHSTPGWEGSVRVQGYADPNLGDARSVGGWASLAYQPSPHWEASVATSAFGFVSRETTPRKLQAIGDTNLGLTWKSNSQPWAVGLSADLIVHSGLDSFFGNLGSRISALWAWEYKSVRVFGNHGVALDRTYEADLSPLELTALHLDRHHQLLSGLGVAAQFFVARRETFLYSEWNGKVPLAGSNGPAWSDAAIYWTHGLRLQCFNGLAMDVAVEWSLRESSSPPVPGVTGLLGLSRRF